MLVYLQSLKGRAPPFRVCAGRLVALMGHAKVRATPDGVAQRSLDRHWGELLSGEALECVRCE